MVALPRLMITAPASGHGKTTVATGLMAALHAEGLTVAGFKVGPDYVDPGYHTLATGRPGRNLDPVLCGEQRMVPLLLHGVLVPEPADAAVVEGVMGLFDGLLGGDGNGSTAHVAGLLGAPMVLVVDISSVSRTAAALVHGLHTYDPEVRLAGVILNKAGSPRHAAEVTTALQTTGLPVLGVLPREAGIEVPARHLGLVTAAEQPAAAETVRRLGRRVAAHVDLTAVLRLAHAAPDLDGEPWSPAAALPSSESGRLRHRHAVDSCHKRPLSGESGSGESRSGESGSGESRSVGSKSGSSSSGTRPVVAVAGGRAFTFRYAETDELLRAAGCEPIVFDPLHDHALPAGTAGLYLGGGFPEVHAVELSANTALRADIAGAISAGLPTVAECAGLLYLSESVDQTPMVGAIPGEAAMTSRLTLGYRTAVADRDNLLGPAGGRVHGHEFHRTTITGLDPAASAWLLAPSNPAAPFPDASAPSSALPVAAPPHTSRAWRLLRAPSSMSEVPLASAKCDGPVRDGYADATLHASYLHVHWAGHPELARRFADAVHDFAARGIRWRPGAVPASRPELDLGHHGDAELGEGLVDLAVNVRVPGPPPWLADAIAATIADLAAYPDPTAASRAIAAAHPLHPALASPSSPESGRQRQRHAEENCNKRPLSGEGRGRGTAASAEAHVLPTAGAAEAFTLVARAFRPQQAVVVHPQFTEPEAALRAAGQQVHRVLLSAHDGFRLDPTLVPPGADLVVIGNPTNPTSVLHARAAIRTLVRPGRLVVVDEAFMDAVPGEPETLLDGGPLDGVLVLRSSTKTWGVAGLRAGYVVGDPAAVAALHAQQPPWSASTPALAVLRATLTASARAMAAEAAEELTGWRELLVGGLADLGLPVVADPRAPFVLVAAHDWEIGRTPGWLRATLRDHGFAARRCDTFPGLDAGWLRIAVREPSTTESLLKTLRVIRSCADRIP